MDANGKAKHKSRGPNPTDLLAKCVLERSGFARSSISFISILQMLNRFNPRGFNRSVVVSAPPAAGIHVTSTLLAAAKLGIELAACFCPGSRGSQVSHRQSQSCTQQRLEPKGKITQDPSVKGLTPFTG